MNRKSQILLSLSFIAFLFLYVIQDARIDLLVKKAVFNVETTMYLVSLLFIIVGWIYIFCTGRKESVTIKWKKLDVCLLVFVLSLLVTFCFHSKCQVIVSLKKHEGVIPTLLILEGIALLALPSLMYVLSWMREKSVSIITLKWYNFLQSKYFNYSCLGIVTIGILLMLYYSFSLSLWGDEAYTIVAIQHDYSKLTLITAGDVHPPLYYYIVKILADVLTYFFPQLSYIYAARLVSVAPYILMVLICVTWVRQRWGNCAAGLGAVALVAMPHMLEYAVEIRMYGWSMLWVTCCWLSVYDILCHNRWRDWIQLVIFGLAAAYTHYWACVAVVIPYLILAAHCIRVGGYKALDYCDVAEYIWLSSLASNICKTTN